MTSQNTNPTGGTPGAGTAKSAQRADYASTRDRSLGAWIESVEPGSPAWEAGVEPGMRIDRVNGVVPRDIIDWRWYASDDEAELEVFNPDDGEEYEATLYREPGQDWGVNFTDVLFDGIRTCVNACQFCFMRMLPDDARASLMLRDDDYRLSFLQGNFVTLTNMTQEDVERVIGWRLEPMNVSIHAVSPEVRRSLIGPKAQRGMEVLEQLCDAGIEVHGQIVLCAGINDGEELHRTLDWVEAHDAVTSLAIVPMGYTKYSRNFSHSFSEDQEASRAVVKLIEPYQKRARERLGITRFQLSDEFYLDAGLPVPEADTYDGYPQFYDGIGMLRSFIDEARDICDSHANDLAAISADLERRDARVLAVCGEAAAGVMRYFVEAWGKVMAESHAMSQSPRSQSAAMVQNSVPQNSGGAACHNSEPPVPAARVEQPLVEAKGAVPCADARIDVTPIHNDYYGGDVNVTGLIVSCDLLAQLPAELAGRIVVLPEVMFNFDKVTLDGDTQAHIIEEICRRGGDALVVQTTPGMMVDVLRARLGLG